MQNQMNNGDFAILYRTNAQSRSMEDALKAWYSVSNLWWIVFYQRKEIKDVLCYLISNQSKMRKHWCGWLIIRHGYW
jgi:DNA helicase-2/ATP-dependent DNA helicase PcrA